MEVNASHKSRTVLETPVLLFDCELPDGRVERWASHPVTAGGAQYSDRLIKHSNFSISMWNLEGGAGSSRVQVVLANSDAYASQVESTCGWKGAKLHVRFCFFDTTTGEAVTEPESVFRGTANAPEEYDDTKLKLSFNNRLNLERMVLPTVRIQPRCPWDFPATQSQREEAALDGAISRYSPFRGCGYSADVSAGRGNLQNGAPFDRCGKTKSDCIARGMFEADAAAQATARFGGCQFLPPSVLVRSHGDKAYRTVQGVSGSARAGDLVPMVYGTSWHQPQVIFSRSDGNYVHYEVLLGLGPMEGVRKVLYDGLEIPEGVSGVDYGGTGWWSLLSRGEARGSFNPQFKDGNGNPLGDPHGGIAVLTVALPEKQASASPKFQVLMDGLRLPRYGTEGEWLDETFTRNPAWVMLDMLRRAGWPESELDLGSFAAAAGRFAQLKIGTDATGSEVQLPVAETGLALTTARSISDLIRGLQAASQCYMSLNKQGKLALTVEGPIADQQSTKPDTSNSETPINGGWPAYEFGDGSYGSGGIVMDDSGAARLRFWSRPNSSSPNRFSLEYQDSLQDYRQNNLSVVDLDDVRLSGQEVSATHPAMGILSGMQAGRVLRSGLHRTLRGNRFFELESGVHAIGLRPGDLVAMSYERNGLVRSLFRVLSIEPSQNFERVRIAGQKHEDDWYTDAWEAGDSVNGQEGWQGTLPRPLAGRVLNPQGEEEYLVEETVMRSGAGGSVIQLDVQFTPPKRLASSRAGIPLVEGAEVLSLTGGALAGGKWYYAFSARDAELRESGLSLVLVVDLPSGATKAQVRFGSIRTDAGASSVLAYRGRDPQRLRLIAEIPASAGTMVDNGLPALLIPPPDGAYFDAHFYWRQELVGATPIDAVNGSEIHAAAFSEGTNQFVGATVVITSGKGRGQESTILSHQPGMIQVTGGWEVVPDSTSEFCVVEPTWRTGGTSTQDRVGVEVSNHPRATVHLAGVTANNAGEESPMRLAPLMRYRLVGDESAAEDFDVPGMPVFAVSSLPGGLLELSNLGVEALENSRSVHSGTLAAHYVNEMSEVRYSLGLAMNAGTDTLTAVGLESFVGDHLLVGGEIVQVTDVLGGGAYGVSRGEVGSFTVPHTPGEWVTPLLREVHAIPLSGGFFGSPAASHFSATFPFGNRRLVGADFCLTNRLGDGPPARECYTFLAEGGLVFPKGNSYTIESSGLLAIQSGVGPGVLVVADAVVQRVEGMLREAATGGSAVVRLWVDEALAAELMFPPGGTEALVSQAEERLALTAGSRIRAEIVEVPTSAGGWPGRDLSITLAL